MSINKSKKIVETKKIVDDFDGIKNSEGKTPNLTNAEKEEIKHIYGLKGL